MAILNVRSVPAISDQNCDPKGAIRLINKHKKVSIRLIRFERIRK